MEIMHTDKAPAAVGPYSQAVKTGNLLFCSGQIGLNPATGEMVGTTVAEQAKQVMENVKALLENAGATFDNVVKTTCFIADKYASLTSASPYLKKSLIISSGNFVPVLSIIRF